MEIFRSIDEIVVFFVAQRSRRSCNGAIKEFLDFLDLTSPVTNADVIVFSGAGHVFDVSLRFFFCSRC